MHCSDKLENRCNAFDYHSLAKSKGVTGLSLFMSRGNQPTTEPSIGAHPNAQMCEYMQHVHYSALNGLTDAL